VADLKNPHLRADALRNRDRLLAAAREELRAGVISLQLNDIARKAGVGVGTAYRHFPTPHAMLEAAVADQLEQLAAAARDALEDDDTRRAVIGLLRTTLELQMASDGGLGTVLAASEDANEATTLAKAEITRNTQELLRRAHRGKIVRRDVTAMDVRNLMCGVERAVRVDSDDHAERADRYLAILVDGLRPVTKS
jgi:AcrR family transcriptional regulator